MPHLKVRFDEPEHGWIGLSLATSDEVHHYNCSYAGLGAGTFEQLTRALLALTDQQGRYQVEWFYNPDCLRLVFTREEDQIELVVAHVDNPFTVPIETFGWFQLRGTYDEICLPFWRALRTLQGLYPEAEFKARWHYPFPTRQLALLTQQLGKG